MKFIYSTLATDVLYVTWANNDPKQNSIAEREILIRGGAGVRGGVSKDKHDNSMAVGVLTEVSDTDFDLLLQNSIFQLHVQNGFISFAEKKAESIEAAVAKMEPKDASAQLNEEFYDKSENKDLAKPDNGKKVKNK